MSRHLLGFFALALIAAPAAAAAEPEAEGGWDLARAEGSCMLHSASPQGTVVSIWGFAGQEKLGFLIQNRDWKSLREGQSYDLELGFTGTRAWPVQATARRDLDSDGPGYFFTFKPADAAEGGSILDSIAAAKGMKISRDGAAVATMPLDGSRDAVASLARCISDLWSVPREEMLDKADAEPTIDPQA